MTSVRGVCESGEPGLLAGWVPSMPLPVFHLTGLCLIREKGLVTDNIFDIYFSNLLALKELCT